MPTVEKKRYCGSHYWIELRSELKGLPLKDRLYTYEGTTEHKGLIYHMFRSKRGNILLTNDQIMRTLGVFKPFVLNIEEVGAKVPFDPYKPGGIV